LRWWLGTLRATYSAFSVSSSLILETCMDIRLEYCSKRSRDGWGLYEMDFVLQLPIHLTRGFSSSLWTGIITSSQIVYLTLLQGVFGPFTRSVFWKSHENHEDRVTALDVR
jgi:hypothetical protein